MRGEHLSADDAVYQKHRTYAILVPEEGSSAKPSITKFSPLPPIRRTSPLGRRFGFYVSRSNIAFEIRLLSEPESAEMYTRRLRTKLKT